LTDKTSDDGSEASEASETTEAAETTEAPEAAESDSGDADDETDAEKPEDGSEDAAAEEVVEPAAAEDGDSSAPKKKRRGWLSAAVVAVVAALFVGAAAFAGATAQPYLADRAAVAIKLNVARTAANAITTLWTYTPENMDSLADRAANYLSGDFGAQYRKFVDTIVAPNKQAKVSNSTEVTGVAVESLDGTNAVTLVYTNTTTTSPLTKNIPAMKYLSYRLIMKRDRGRWLVTRMTTITSLDLTPHL
jgi:Mce-associated membrane protein